MRKILTNAVDEIEWESMPKIRVVRRNLNLFPTTIRIVSSTLLVNLFRLLVVSSTLRVDLSRLLVDFPTIRVEFHRLKVKLTTIRTFRPLFPSFALKKAVFLMRCSSRKSDQLFGRWILSDSRPSRMRKILTKDADSSSWFRLQKKDAPFVEKDASDRIFPKRGMLRINPT